MSEEATRTDLAAADSERSDGAEDTKTKAPIVEVEASEDEADQSQKDGDDDSESAEDDSDKGDEDRPRKKSRSERLRQQNERLRIENAQLKSGSAAPAVHDAAGLAQVIAERLGDEPKEADFNGDWLKYERAMTAYEADKRQVTRQVTDEVRQAQTAQAGRTQELIEDYQEHCEATVKTIPDFYKVVNDPGFKTSNLVKSLILEAGEKAPLVAYHLAKNPRDAARINALPPVEAAREIGRIEGRVSAPKPKTATSATPPLSSVKGGASPSRGLGKSMSDYERWRNS